jgi:hypothetical protein
MLKMRDNRRGFMGVKRLGLINTPFQGQMLMNIVGPPPILAKKKRLAEIPGL